MIGWGRCCVRDDNPNDFSHHPIRRKGSRQILHWEKWHEYSYSSKKLYDRLGEKPQGLATLFQDSQIPEDGIYCEGETLLNIPSIGQFIPTSPKFIPPSDDVPF